MYVFFVVTGNEDATEGDEAVTHKAMDSAKHFGSEYDMLSRMKHSISCFRAIFFKGEQLYICFEEAT
jgi:hypothetical protein